MFSFSVCEARHVEIIRTILHGKIDKLGYFYGRFFENILPSSHPDHVQQNSNPVEIPITMANEENTNVQHMNINTQNMQQRDIIVQNTHTGVPQVQNTHTDDTDMRLHVLNTLPGTDMANQNAPAVAMGTQLHGTAGDTDMRFHVHHQLSGDVDMRVLPPSDTDMRTAPP